MRGVAAMSVVAYHFGTLVAVPHFFAHAYLAVDLFFCLSGFVLANAYIRPLTTGALSFKRFVVVRLVRLYPLALLGALMGLLVLLFIKPEGLAPGWLEVASALTLLPLTAVLKFGGSTFHANPPTWSLFFELAVNGAFAAFPSIYKTKWPVALACVASSVFFVIGTVLLRATFNQGAVADVWLWGFPRSFATFFLGVGLWLIHDKLPQFRMPPWLLYGTLIAIFLSPGGGGTTRVVVDLVLALGALPVLVLAGSFIPTPPSKMARFLGDVSYPLYVVHLPVTLVLSAALVAYHVGTLGSLAAFLVVLTVLVIASEYLARAYDKPVRDTLSRRLFRLVRANI